ncbi:MAG TPA: type VI secretion system baseplate subunit TssG [Blastocatellia bacterium]|nr:type VI secretion system baseplate subunit TssG [Blastocatellia bacterium]
MATEVGGTSNSLADVLFEEPYRFEFFQAVRLLERIEPERRPVGRYSEPAGEAVRFRTRVSLSFPPSQIYGLARAGEEESKPSRMTVAFMGLTGPAGVLPHHYTELLIERTRYKDTALAEFLDLFNHRMISLFYRAWEKYRFPVAYERGEDDRFTEFLFDIVGMGTRGLRNRQSFPDEILLFYGGLFAMRPHSASAMCAALGDYFGATARMEQFSGQWLKLDDESLTRLGGENAELGVTTVAGTRVWDVQSKFELQFGPLSFSEFTGFLPTGSAFKPAAELTRLMAGMEFDFDIRLTLKAEEVPGCVLTTRAKRAPMLGWTTWLKTSPFREDDSQVVLSVRN